MDIVVVNHGGDLFHKPSSLEQEEELGQLLTEPLTSLADLLSIARGYGDRWPRIGNFSAWNHPKPSETIQVLS